MSAICIEQAVYHAPTIHVSFGSGTAISDGGMSRYVYINEEIVDEPWILSKHLIISAASVLSYGKTELSDVMWSKYT